MRASLLPLMLAAACATRGAPAGSSITLLSSVDYHAAPVTYAVGAGHVRSNNAETLDAYFEKNCLKGEMAGEPLDLCQRGVGEDGTQHWEGTTGVIDIKPIENGMAFQVSGYVQLSTLRQMDVSQTLRPEQGGAWEQFRQQPVLLLVATTATDLNALHHRRRRGI
jgi:hypothetical protein